MSAADPPPDHDEPAHAQVLQEEDPTIACKEDEADESAPTWTRPSRPKPEMPPRELGESDVDYRSRCFAVEIADTFIPHGPVQLIDVIDAGWRWDDALDWSQNRIDLALTYDFMLETYMYADGLPAESARERIARRRAPPPATAFEEPPPPPVVPDPAPVAAVPIDAPEKPKSAARQLSLW